MIPEMTVDENLPPAENFYQDFSPRKPSKPENQFFFPEKSPAGSNQSLGSLFIDSLNERNSCGESPTTSTWGSSYATPSPWPQRDHNKSLNYSPNYNSSEFCEESNIYGSGPFFDYTNL